MSPEGAPALAIDGLRHGHADPQGGRHEVLRLDHLELPRGGELVVEGESGSGKTTLLHLIAGILAVQQGTIRVLGEPLEGSGEAARDRLRARHIGLLFQTFNLLPHLTALENVAVAMSFRPRGGETPEGAARAALERVGLGARLHHRPFQLSVGQQQRVAIARALAGHPGLVLADEPTANLDGPRARSCLGLLREFAAEREAALLVVTHDPYVVAEIGARVTLRAPEAVEEGSA